MKIRSVFLSLTIGIILSVPLSANELNLSEFEKNLENANKIDNIKVGSPEGILLESLNEIAETIRDKQLSIKELEATLTLLDSTDLIEESLPKASIISFPDDFLAGSNLTLSDMTNASYFLNSLNKKKLENLKNIESLSSDVVSRFASTQSNLLELSQSNVSEIISQLEATPSIDLVQLSSAVVGATENINDTLSKTENSVGMAVSNASEDISKAAQQINSATASINSATQTLSFAAGAAMASAAYSLEQAANAIANTIAAGVAVDLDAASQGLGYDDFASAVEAYNQQHGTNYTVETAKEALGQ
ncbi:MAG: hypothetical protein CMN53_00915 [SAR116 cluster bacterium]|nr:hypothetical protein [SAR116 cluster bacterium]